MFYASVRNYLKSNKIRKVAMPEFLRDLTLFPLDVTFFMGGKNEPVYKSNRL